MMFNKVFWMEKIRQWRMTLARPVDPVNLGCFRICFGILMLFYIYRYRSSSIVSTVYLSSDFHFTFPLFEILGLPLPTAAIMSVILKVMAVSALFITLGLFTRVSSAVFLLTFGYMFLIEKALYQNHYYLILLLSFLFIITGSNRFLAFDAQIFRKQKKYFVPYWHLFLFQVQIALVYFYGGFANLNTDWISGLVTQNIFAGASDGFFFATAIGGIILNLCAGVLIMFKSARLSGIVLMLFLQIFIKVYLDVDVHPYLMISSIVLFLESAEIRNFLGLFREKKGQAVFVLPREIYADPSRAGVWVFIGVYLFIQVMMPLRFILLKGPVSWTQIGDRFSWRFFSRENQGHIDFFVTDVLSGNTIEVPRLKGITAESYSQMTFHPDMILQYARYLHGYYQNQGIYSPIVTANSYVSYNGRPFSLFINPDLNLAHPGISLGVQELIFAAPVKSTTTKVVPKNVGRFFSPAYQLAVIEEKTLIPGDHPTVSVMQERIDRLAGDEFISPYQITNLVVDLKQILYWEYGRHFTVLQILDKLIEKFGPFITIPSIDKLLKLFIQEPH